MPLSSRYPRPDEYLAVIQHPETALTDPELKIGKIRTNNWGLPIFVSGAFAVTYTIIARNRLYAVRCFHRKVDTLEQRYDAISQKLKQLRSDYFVPFEFQKDGIRVQQDTYPIVKMDWVNGITLGEFVEQQYQNIPLIQALQHEIENLGHYLEQQGIAHGDIQPANIMVLQNGTTIQLKLIDYDGMYVPAIHNLGASEVGLAQFQHPKRDLTFFDETLDRFSLICLSIVLEALTENPRLWEQTNSDSERFLFDKTDFEAPEHSPVFQLLFGMSASLSKKAYNFAAICHAPFRYIPPFSDFLSGKNIPSAHLSVPPPCTTQSPSVQPTWNTPLVSQPSPNGNISNTAKMQITKRWLDGLNYEKAGKDEKAFDCFREAAKLGDKEAQYKVAWYCYHGKGISFNDDSKTITVSWLRQAAMQNHAQAQYDLGYLYEIGVGVQKNQAQAQFWYDKASAQGISKSNLVQLNSQQKDGNFTTASIIPMIIIVFITTMLIIFLIYTCIRATNKNNSYSYTPPPVAKVDYYSQALSLYNNKQYKKAFPLMQNAAKEGNADAQLYLGWMYANGQGIKRNYAQAVSWLRKSANQGNALAQNDLGLMYAEGRGVKRNYAQAISWYRKSAEQGNAYAQNNLGWMYVNGRGIIQDDQQAVFWLKKAAEQGNAYAQTNLGWMYENGRGVIQDDQQAVLWYRKAAEQGNANAQNNLGVMYENGRGVIQDAQQAAFWYREAANQGNAGAQNNLGVMYENGRGVIQDAQQAVFWYRKAANQGNALAQINLGTMYFKGQGVIQDAQQAAFWYRKAANQGNALAQNALGLMYEAGLGVMQDYQQAIFWYRKAAEQGDLYAQEQLRRLGYGY